MYDLSANKQVCLDFYAMVSKRRFKDAINYVADDVIWWVQGSTPVSGFHHGKADVYNLFAPLEYGLTEDLEIEFGALTAEEDRVALEMKSSASLQGGGKYENNYHFLFTIKDGKIFRAKEYLDTKILSDLLNAGAT